MILANYLLKKSGPLEHSYLKYALGSLSGAALPCCSRISLFIRFSKSKQMTEMAEMAAMAAHRLIDFLLCKRKQSASLVFPIGELNSSSMDSS